VSVAKAAVAVPISAHAKLNLGLRVVGRRADGYHLLESLFVPLDLADVLRLAITRDVPRAVSLRVEGATPELGADESNLAARAARAFLQAADLDAEVDLELEKVIPVGAGLGGGSSDAGSVLRMLDAAFPGALGPERLAAVALALGADVPYFLDPRPALVTGIGEHIEPLADVPSLPVLMATPAPPLPTAHVFRAFAAASATLTPAEGTRRIPPLPALLEASRGTETRVGRVLRRVRPVTWARSDDLQTLLANDLEAVATRLQPAIGRLRTEIARAGARAVGMSGSGPTVFGVFESADEARTAAAEIRWEPSDRVHVGRTAGSP
jgi:4-diphosphocytidyl-2-C-methyl-D-erythritol kinase